MNNSSQTPEKSSLIGQSKDTKNRALNPVFEHLSPENIAPATIITSVQGMREKAAKERKENENTFPVEVFPKSIQNVINATNASLNFPIDFIGAPLLYAASVAIGNTHKIELKRGYVESAVLYIAIVGKPGTNKSHPLSFALGPIEERDSEGYKRYKEDKIEYERIFAMSKKERMEQGFEIPSKPVWRQILVSDFTPEALVEVHEFNPRGIGVNTDELASWFKNFNRYTKGADEQFWLSNYSSKPIRVNRKTSDSLYISSPFISVVGTIQPGILYELAKGRTYNGFMDRILFVFPANLKQEYWRESELDPAVTNNWKAIINNLLDLDIRLDERGNIDSYILRFTPTAKKRLIEWQKEQVDIANSEDNEEILGITAKMQMYVLRLALCLEMMRFACGESEKQAVGIDSVEGAIKLVVYFTRSALKVNDILSNVNPLEQLSGDKKALYHALPDIFTTNEGLNIAEKMKIPERTFKHFISNQDIFYHSKRGQYEKKV